VPYCQKYIPTDCFFGDLSHWVESRNDISTASNKSTRLWTVSKKTEAVYMLPKHRQLVNNQNIAYHQYSFLMTFFYQNTS